MWKIGLLVVAFLLGNVITLMADEPAAYILGPDGKPIKVSVKKPSGGGESKPGGGSGDQNGSDKNKGDKKKGGKDKEEAEKDSVLKVIRRGDIGGKESDPEELKSTVGDDGKVAFQFRNQAWGDLMQWLSDISSQPVDWLELPGDRVNLASPDRYTVAETQDLFNRHLLARGYTILELDGGLMVAKTETINPSMVPRVSPEQLSTLQPHTFVRTSLDTGWLSAEKLTQEMAAMISTNGRLTAMTTTNRIEAMDAAINLQDVVAILQQERSDDSRKALAPEFPLRYLPAEEAKLMLEEFLGVKKEKSRPMTPQQMQMMQQMQQRNQGKGAPPEKKVEISIVANTRQNSVLIRAPADRLAIAHEFLKRVDVRNDSMASLSDIEKRVEVFRLASLDPNKLIEILGEMNVLEPATRVKVDSDNNALIVSGSAPDRFIIRSLIDRLDGSGRSFQVLQLRRLSATDVAESIGFLMGQEKEEEKTSSRRYYYYGYGNDQEEEKNGDEFRVAANERFRQVLLWANEMEMEQVESLLIKLGELPPPGGSPRTMRTIDASPTPETYLYLQRLQRQWGATSGNPLELPDHTQFKDPIKEEVGTAEDAGAMDDKAEDDTADDMDEKSDETKEAPLDKPAGETTVAAGRDSNYQLTAMQSEDSSAGAAAPPIRSARDFDKRFKPQPAMESDGRPASPIRIEIDSEGNLVLLSSDTKALDKLEQLMLQMKPPRRPYRVFKIKHASALWVRLNLDEYFKSDEEDDDAADQLYRWWYDIEDNADDGPTGLGKGNKLRFVEDIDTGTIVVSGATSEQLRTIEELIELWDVDEPTNKRKMRFTDLVQIEFGQAEKISETVKEAYRDLLSSNDKSFQGRGGRGGGGGQNQDQRQQTDRKREGNGSGLVDSQNGNEGGDADFSFKGKLSIGVDPIGNTLLVSAEGEALLELVTDMIGKLDVAAKSAGEVQIFQLSGDVSSQSMQRALKAFGAESTNVSAKSRRKNDDTE